MIAKRNLLTTIVLLCCCAIIAGCDSDTVAPTESAEAPILPPARITAVPSFDGVILSWVANTQGHLLGYHVYRTEIGSSMVYKLTGRPINENRYVDKATQWGHRYEYRVTSVSVGGAESNIVTTVIQLPGNTGSKRHRSE
jgi:fibronectin type 3 domain-containing protein